VAAAAVALAADGGCGTAAAARGSEASATTVAASVAGANDPSSDSVDVAGETPADGVRDAVAADVGWVRDDWFLTALVVGV